MKTANIKFSLNTFSDQITIYHISFEIFDVKQIYAQVKKVNIWTPLGYFSFLFHFSVDMK